MTALIRRRLVLLAPLGVAAAGGAAFLAMLRGMESGHFDPRGIPSTLIGKPLPAFALPGLGERRGFASGDLAGLPGPVLLNFFASWCVPCVQEAPQLVTLRDRGVPVWGIAYKDKTADTEAFLTRNGDPYARLAVDQAGTVAIDFGLYGVPETYLIDRHGIVRWRWAGGLSADVVRQELDPLLRDYA